MRSFEDNFAWVRSLPDSIDLTVVVATWMQRGGKLHGDQKPERLRAILPYAVTDALPPSWLEADLLEVLPGLRKAAEQRAGHDMITEEAIRAVLPTAIIHIEPQLRFTWFEQDRLASADPRGSDPFSMQMLYKIWQADNMRRNIEHERGRTFDIVVRARPDRPLTGLPLELLSKVRPGQIWLQDLYHERRYVGDMLAFGDSGTMDVYGSFFHEALRRAQAGEWQYIHTDLYQYLTSRGLQLCGCELLGPFALDRLLDVSDLLTATEHAAADASRSRHDPIRAHAAIAARSVRLAEQLGRGAASLADDVVIDELTARLAAFEPARDTGLLHWIAVNANSQLRAASATSAAARRQCCPAKQKLRARSPDRVATAISERVLSPETRLFCASVALTALADPSKPGLAYPLIISFCVAHEALTKASNTLYLSGAETLDACTSATFPEPLRTCLTTWLAAGVWRTRIAAAIDATLDSLLDQDPGFWMRLATHADEFGNPALAEATLRRVLARRPDEPQVPQLLAFLLDKLGRRDEAAALARMAMQAAPENAHILHNAGFMFLRAGQIAEAVAAGNASIALEPDNARFHLHLSAALSASGDQTAALKSAQTAADLAPTDDMVLEHLGRQLHAAPAP